MDGINKFKFTFNEDDIVDLVSNFSSDKTMEEQEVEIRFLKDNPKVFEDLVRQLAFGEIKDFGITCFSGKADDMLMWSHYADEHRGICIQFNLFEELESATNDGKIDIEKVNLFFIRKINYQNKIPTVDYKEIFRERFSPCYHKSKNWEYEDEYRAIRPCVGLYPFHKACIKSIYFGLDCSEADQEDIQQLILRSDYSGVEFYRMTENASSYDLGTEII